MSLEEEKGYEEAYEQACEELKKADIVERCERGGAKYEEGRIIINFLNRDYVIKFPEIKFCYLDSQGEVPQKEKILILHYLIKAKGVPPSEGLVDFRQVPSGDFYYSSFENRAKRPFLSAFGERVELLLEAAARLRCVKADYGDFGVTIPALPKVPITFVIWKGNDEFPPDGNILFDSTISDYLPTEDIVLVCQSIVERLIANKN